MFKKKSDYKKDEDIVLIEIISTKVLGLWTVGRHESTVLKSAASSIAIVSSVFSGLWEEEIVNSCLWS